RRPRGGPRHRAPPGRAARGDGARGEPRPGPGLDVHGQAAGHGRAMASISRRAAHGSSTGDHPSLQGLRVLLVEDDRDTAEVLESLVTASGAKATTASSVAEALDVLARQRVDVLVSDIGLPGDDGYALIHRLREREHQQW